MDEEYTYNIGGETRELSTDEAISVLFELRQSDDINDRMSYSQLRSDLESSYPDLLNQFDVSYASYMAEMSNQSRKEDLRDKALENKETFDKYFKSEVKKSAVTAIPTVLQLGKGIADYISGRKAQNKLSKPREPQIKGKNEQLSTRLQEAQVDSQQVDPRYRSQREADVARSIASANQVARSVTGGNPAVYAAQAQANALRGADVLRQGDVQDQDRLAQNKRVYDALIRQSMNEDQRIYQNRVGKYRRGYKDYVRDHNNAMDLSSTGLDNSTQALVDLANRASDYFGLQSTRDVYFPEILPVDQNVQRASNPISNSYDQNVQRAKMVAPNPINNAYAKDKYVQGKYYDNPILQPIIPQDEVILDLQSLIRPL